MAIRYDKALNREIAQAVRKFNSKVYRLERLQREVVPPRASVKGLKEQFTSRADLLRRIKQLQGFSERGAEKVVTTKAGVKTTAWELKTLKEQVKIQKLRLTREIKRVGSLTPTVYGRPQARRYEQMGSEELSNLQARRERLNKNIEMLDTEQFKRFSSQVQKDYASWDTKRGAIFRESYYRIIDDLAYHGNIPQEQVDHIKEAISKLTLPKLGALFDVEKAFKEIIDEYEQVKLKAGVVETATDKFGNPIIDKKTGQPINVAQQTFSNLDQVIDELVEQYA